jgi:hypothetical protein
MHALIFAALFSAQPVADETVVVVNIATVPLKDAERLDGKRVVTTFRIGAPPFTWGAGANLVTVTAPKYAGSEERTVILKGDRLDDADLGKKLTVVGTIRVVRHPDSTINGKTFSGFTEIRIEER